MPAETIFEGVKNFTAFTDAVCPLRAAAGDVASKAVFELFHTRIKPSNEPERMRDPATSTEETQSSCSKLEMWIGGINARTYSTLSVVSAEIALAVRNSSMVVRRNWPLIKNSKGMGFSDSSRLLTRVERAYRFSAVHVSARAFPSTHFRETDRFERELDRCLSAAGLHRASTAVSAPVKPVLDRPPWWWLFWANARV